MPTEQGNKTRQQRLVKWIIDSPTANTILKLPPVAWIIKSITRRIVRWELNKPSTVDLSNKVEEHVETADLTDILNTIVRDMVDALGYIGAMVATYDPGDCLVVRAYYIDPSILTDERVHTLEDQVSQVTGLQLSLSDPSIARVYRYNNAHKQNLSVRAVEARKPVIDKNLYSLFIPIIPSVAENFIRGVQEEFGISRVMAVPFFIADQKDPVGNLFVAKHGEINEQDITILQTIGRHAASALENERRKQELIIVQQLALLIQANLHDEAEILRHISDGVVQLLGYAGAMVATCEGDGSLPVRAYYLNPTIATPDKIVHWERMVSDLTGIPLSISDPEIARVYLNDPAYSNNLSVEAAQSGHSEVRDDLIALFRPVVPDTEVTRDVIGAIQEELGIQKVIAVPFFFHANDEEKELVGNLFAATRSREFTRNEIAVLERFGQQAASGIRNSRLYRLSEEQRKQVEQLYELSEAQRKQVEHLYQLSEERREVAQVFGKMAFSASAYIHELRGHIGFVKITYPMVSNIGTYSPDLQDDIRKSEPIIMEKLETVTAILDKLHEPWKQSPDSEVDVNTSIRRAIDKAFRNTSFEMSEDDLYLSSDLPTVLTSHDMLTEVFRVLIKNAYEAIRDSEVESGRILVRSATKGDNAVEVQIQDNGLGIKPENLSHIFELRWSTKKYGMGFGLFWVKDYIDNLGGSIKVESEAGHGTTFWVILPVKHEETNHKDAGEV